MKLPTVVRRWAYVGALVGAGVSVAANVLHSYVPPDGMPPAWHPAPGAVVGAVFWPVALLVAIEIFARWHPTALRFKTLRWAGLAPVAVVAAVVSYRHMSGLLAYWREDWVTVVIGPLAVDGLMVMAAGALIATSPSPIWAAGSTWSAAPSVTALSLWPDQGGAGAPAGATSGTVRDVTPPVTPEDAGTVPSAVVRLAAKQSADLGRAALLDAMRTARTTNPNATQDDVASAVGRSKRTVARYWNWPDAMPTPSPNGATKHDP